VRAHPPGISGCKSLRREDLMTITTADILVSPVFGQWSEGADNPERSNNRERANDDAR